MYKHDDPSSELYGIYLLPDDAPEDDLDIEKSDNSDLDDEDDDEVDLPDKSETEIPDKSDLITD